MEQKKTISIVVPTFNEIENAVPVANALIGEITTNLPEYDYELLFIDNNSTDGTRDAIRQLCAGNKHIKAIFNLKNFGPDNSPYYGMLQATGDCVILFTADFQDPLDMIHKMVREWEKGHKVITAIKASSQENGITRFFRSVYYKAIRKISNTEIIEHFTGFGLYDRSFMDVLRTLDDPIPFLRGIVAEFSEDRLEMPYEQLKRRAGKSHIKFFSLYDIAMRSITSYTKIGLRLATFGGFAVAIVSFIVAIIYFIYKLTHWDSFSAGMAPVTIGMFFLGAVQLSFLGLLGEYVMSINLRIMNRPIVIESERINFDEKENEDV
ncbi:glycosyltransferase family 2 protein [Butyrivibrio sp. WCD2001]|uniref:glycosyltransferase family 2 protein n=1 Tax=Butyrivibrio sp. WCD2001 TaxID=1280681 RepID=UPI0003FBDA8B|nr:glycosyltransferase family 2 protein [Butyrivibrio sp. WCD2001]